MSAPLDPHPLAPHLMPVAQRPPLIMVRGHGSWIQDEQGHEYLDLVQGWAVNALGHAPPEIAQVLTEQAGMLLNPSPGFLNRPLIDLTNRLAHLTGLDQVFVCSTGAEANEGAIKLARRYGADRLNGAHEIIVIDGAFHGRTLATMSASGRAGWDRLFAPKVDGFLRVAATADAVIAAIGPRTCAVLLEPIRGESGVLPLADGDLRRIRAATQQAGVLLCLDEVQTGVGRTGRFLASEHAGVRPDIVTLGKGLGSGVPIAAVCCRSQVMRLLPGEQGGTYTGNPLMAAVADRVVATIADPLFLTRVVAAGECLRQGLVDLSTKYGLGEVRGRGLLLALELGDDLAGNVAEAAMQRGLLVNAARPSVLRFMPALTISDEEIDWALIRLTEALAAHLPPVHVRGC